MKNLVLSQVCARWVAALVAGFFLMGLLAETKAVTLEDFGYGNMKINGTAARGARPTLVLLMDLANTGSFSHPTSYYDNLVFNPLNIISGKLRSVDGFMLVNSHARFSLARAGVGVLGPLGLVPGERQASRINDFARAGFAIKAAVATGFNFAQFDDNGDGKITADELLVLVFDNLNQVDSGAARWADPTGAGAGSFQPAGSTVSFALSVGLMTQQVSFATLCHEMSHLLGTKDLYGIWNVTAHNVLYTLMSATITNPDDLASYQLDAWHKLQLGWVEPRIRLLGTGGLEAIVATQSVAATDAPVILYDPARGTSEFFLVEYRTSTSPWGAGYEDDVPSNGLGIWHVIQDANKNLVEFVAVGQSVWLEGQPNLARGQDKNMLWTSGTTTPVLTWRDGTTTSTRIAVRPFNAGDGSISFEWFTPSDTWADFLYRGTELGTFAQPFNTLAEAVNAASRGGTVKFKQGGTSRETLSIAKRVELQATGGAITIGR